MSSGFQHDHDFARFLTELEVQIFNTQYSTDNGRHHQRTGDYDICEPEVEDGQTLPGVHPLLPSNMLGSEEGAEVAQLHSKQPARLPDVGQSRKTSDLKRHRESVHEGLTFPCPYPSCYKHADGYTRKDKLNQHLKECHPLVRCTLSHCSAEICNIDSEQEKHITEDHDVYECALGQCQNTGASRFTEDQLKRHLKADHNMSRGALANVIANMRISDTATVEVEHFPNNCRLRPWKDCSKCAS